MCDTSSRCRTEKWLFLVSTFLLLLAMFTGTPGYLRADAGETGEIYFSILHTNDLHSALIPHSPAVDYHPDEDDPAIGGIGRLATAVNEIRQSKKAQGEPVLLFDAGDFLGGAAFAWLAPQGHAAELTIMQEIGYEAVVIGNHEYDYGPDVLAEYLLAAGYPESHDRTLILGSNTEAPQEHPLAARDLYRDTGMFELENGLKVGVFGLMGEDAILVIGEPGDVQFTDQHEAARRAVSKLRQDGADVVVALTHSGLEEDRELAREVAGIDVIVGGHCHTTLHQPVLEGTTIIVQAGSLGRFLGQLELAYNTGTGAVRVRNEENGRPFLITIDSSFASDPEIGAMVEEYTLILNAHVYGLTGGGFDDVMSTVARSGFVLSNEPSFSETPLGNFVADAMRMVAREITGKSVDIAAQASGSIRKCVSPGSAAYSEGNISFYEIVEAVSIGYGRDGYAGCPIASLYLTGEEVRRMLEITLLLQEFVGDAFFLHFSGLRYSYNPTNAVLLTVPSIDLPVPTTRAVTGAELYTGDDLQTLNDEDYVPLRRGDETLYHLVTDAYILTFLPMVTELLPQLAIFPKNADGEPVPLDRVDDLIVHHDDGRELKVWEAVVTYAAAQPQGADGIPRIPDYYETTAGRINRTWTFPFLGWLIIILAVIVTGIAFLVRYRIRRRRTRRSARL